MEAGTIKKYLPGAYAKHIGVSPGRVTQVKNKLDKEEVVGGWLVIDTAKNKALFRNK